MWLMTTVFREWNGWETMLSHGRRKVTLPLFQVEREIPQNRSENKKSPYLLRIVCTPIIPLISCRVVGGHQGSIRVVVLSAERQTISLTSVCSFKCLVEVTTGHLFLLLLLNLTKNKYFFPHHVTVNIKNKTRTCGESNTSLSGSSGSLQATPSPFPATT